jgi:hypothetical protein
MGDFQRLVIIIAIIILILILVLTLIVMYVSKSKQTWPPVTGDCPDYWIDLSGNGAMCVNTKRLGTCNNESMNFSVAPWVGSNGLCAKYNWANACGVAWDGINYGVANPCDPSNNST